MHVELCASDCCAVYPVSTDWWWVFDFTFAFACIVLFAVPSEGSQCFRNLCADGCLIFLLWLCELAPLVHNYAVWEESDLCKLFWVDV